MTDSEYMEETARLRPRLLDIARRYMGSGGEADDMVQDTMLRLWVMRAELRSPVERLACAVVRNLCVSRLRCGSRWRTIPISEGDAAAEEIGGDAADDRTERMMTVIERLPDMQQTVLRLRHIDGMSMAEIAELTGCSEVAVRKALSRARQAVRERYDENRQ